MTKKKALICDHQGFDGRQKSLRWSLLGADSLSILQQNAGNTGERVAFRELLKVSLIFLSFEFIAEFNKLFFDPLHRVFWVGSWILERAYHIDSQQVEEVAPFIEQVGIQ